MATGGGLDKLDRETDSFFIFGITLNNKSGIQKPGSQLVESIHSKTTMGLCGWH